MESAFRVYTLAHINARSRGRLGPELRLARTAPVRNVIVSQASRIFLRARMRVIISRWSHARENTSGDVVI